MPEQMRTSQVIARLQAINKNVPFDAEVVTYDGRSIYPVGLTKVVHEPPYTVLEFDSDGQVDGRRQGVAALEEELSNRRWVRDNAGRWYHADTGPHGPQLEFVEALLQELRQSR